MNRLVRRIVVVLTVLAANIFLDRITKWFAELLKDRDPVSFFWNAIVLHYVENTGAFLSLGDSWPEPVKVVIFLALPILVCLGAIAYCLFKKTDAVRTVLIVTIAAGGISNLYDRLFHSFHVTDFLNFGLGNVRTGIMNVADLSVTLGVILLVVYEYSRKTKRESKSKEKKEPEE
jgi:signal peptidase II